MNKKQLGFRVSSEYIEKLERVCQEGYVTKTGMLKKWIDKEFNQLKSPKNGLITNEK